MGKAARPSWWELVQAGLVSASKSTQRLRRYKPLLASVAIVPALAAPLALSPLPSASAAVTKAPSAASPALADPPANIPRTAAMAQACNGDDQGACDAAVIHAIDEARAGEGVGPLHLPSDFGSLSTAAQLLVLADLERSDRGLPGFSGLSADLDSLAVKGAADNTDPQGPDGSDWGSNWAGGEQTALLADYDWMYDDGPGSPNLDCPKAGSSGCWDHRQNILWDYGSRPSMGAAATRVAGVTSMTELFSSAPAGTLDMPLPLGTHSVSAKPAAAPTTSQKPAALHRQVAVLPKKAGISRSAKPAATQRVSGTFRPLAIPAEVIPMQFQVSGVPAIPVTRLVTLSKPVSGFGLSVPFGHAPSK